MNNLFMLGSPFGQEPKGMSFLLGDNLFGNFEVGDQDDDDGDFDGRWNLDSKFKGKKKPSKN